MTEITPFRVPQGAPPVDYVIGRLDRILSEYLVVCETSFIDEPDAQTLKHHADDLIGVGQKALEVLKERGLK